MGSVFARGNKLWLKYKTVAGKWVNKPAKLDVGEERKAHALLKKTEAVIEARLNAGERDEGPLTVRRYGATWIEQRDTHTVKDDAARLENHVYSVLGDLLLVDVRAREVKSLVDGLIRRMKAGEIAPRTVRHIYGTLHTMFEQAREDELIDANPCALKKGYLPKKRDKDPLWRPSAKFTHDEVERVISDERVPEDLRSVCATLALGGLRFGEMAALQWLHHDPEMKPLGRLLLARSYDFKKKQVKGTKTERPREVPVHPTLAKVLAAWKLGGWARLMGRTPKPEDLIFPSAKPELVHGLFRNPNEQRKLFYTLCDLLGIRRRRIHDFRRTFISLARDDGARKDIIRWMTHPPTGDVVDDYFTPAWSTLCEEISKLKIQLREPANVIALPAREAVGGNGQQPARDADEARAPGLAALGTVLGTVDLDQNENGPNSLGVRAASMESGRRDLKASQRRIRVHWSASTIRISRTWRIGASPETAKLRYIAPMHQIGPFTVGATRFPSRLPAPSSCGPEVAT
jgi:integrase